MNILKNQIDDFNIIGAVDNERKTLEVIKSHVGIVFVLGCDIIVLKNIVARIKRSNKLAFVHIDLVNGLGKDIFAVDYIKRNIGANGIISTRHSLINHAKSQGLMTVQRMFLLDSSSVKSGIEMAHKSNADFIELMPGVIPKAIKGIKRHIKQPIIAGGMIDDQNGADDAIHAGAVAVSTSCEELWYKK